MHVFTGDDQSTRLRTFEDSAHFAGAVDSSKMVYIGTALSAGGEWRIRKGLAAQLSYRAPRRACAGTYASGPAHTSRPCQHRT
jgi:hypothetical protein